MKKLFIFCVSVLFMACSDDGESGDSTPSISTATQYIFYELPDYKTSYGKCAYFDDIVPFESGSIAFFLAVFPELTGDCGPYSTQIGFDMVYATKYNIILLPDGSGCNTLIDCPDWVLEQVQD